MDRHNRGDLREEGQKKKKTIGPRENKKLWGKKGSRKKRHKRCGDGRDQFSLDGVLTHSVVVM